MGGLETLCCELAAGLLTFKKGNNMALETLRNTKQKLILELLGLGSEKTKIAPGHEGVKPNLIGKKVLVRTYSAGVHFGTLEYKKGQNVVLKNAHRVHYWAAACSLSQLAMEGDKKLDEARISMAVDTIELDRAIEVITMPDSVFTQLTSKLWKK